MVCKTCAKLIIAQNYYMPFTSTMASASAISKLMFHHIDLNDTKYLISAGLTQLFKREDIKEATACCEGLHHSVSSN